MTKLYWQFRTVIVWTLVLGSAAYFAVSKPSFLSAGNIFSISQSFALIALVSAALGIVMIAGEFDLSIAGVVPLAALITVKLGNTSPALGILAALTVAAVIGAVNAWATARYDIPSLAVTVGTLVLTTGLGFAVSSGDVVTMTNFDIGLFLDKEIVPMFSLRGLTTIAILIALGLLMRFTWLGVSVYATGSDHARASVLGISRIKILLVVFVLSGLLVGIAGAFLGLTLASGTPGANEALLLQAATAAIIGGVSLSGGRGSVLGVAGGALLLSVLSNGLSLLGATTAVVQLVNGILLLLVVLVDVPLSRSLNARMERTVRPKAIAEI